jgi:hypothetical protein
VKLGLWAFVSTYGVRRLLWKMGWMFHEMGRSMGCDRGYEFHDGEGTVLFWG